MIVTDTAPEQGAFVKITALGDGPSALSESPCEDPTSLDEAPSETVGHKLPESELVRFPATLLSLFHTDASPTVAPNEIRPEENGDPNPF